MNLRPTDSALPRFTSEHRDSSVSEVYYEVHMTRVLHTARISDVVNVMFVKRTREKAEKRVKERVLGQVFSQHGENFCTK